MSTNDEAERQQQGEDARAEIKIKMTENGLLVRAGQGWFSFEGTDGHPLAAWPKAAEHIMARLVDLYNKRKRSA